MRRNTTAIVLGLVLMVGSFGGVLGVGQVINPPTIPIAVAVVDIPAGATLTRDMIALDSVRMNPKVVGALITENELDTFVGAKVVEALYAYQPLRKSALSSDGNPAAQQRLALALADPDLVAMVVPVTAATAPGAIVEGDVVDLNFGAGANTPFGERLTTAATPSPLGVGYTGFVPALSPEPTQAVEATPAATATPEPLLMLPVAKTIVSNARVLSVIYDQRSETVQDKDGVKTVRVPDKLIALVLALPREAQELVQFAIDNGTVRVALLSAAAERSAPGARRPSLGMTWNDLVAVVRMERDAVLALGLPTEVIGPGAFAIEATRNAATLTAQPPAASATPGRPPATPAVTATSTTRP